MDLPYIDGFDDELFAVLERHGEMSRTTLSLIASANDPHPVVQKAILSALSNHVSGTYAEGYPPGFKKDGVTRRPWGDGRYYNGCEWIDKLELLAQERGAIVFGGSMADQVGVNVQCQSGAEANDLAFEALIHPGDTMLSPCLNDGSGHLSHGANSPSRIGSKYNVIPYFVDADTGLYDYDEIQRLALEHHPKVMVSGASAYPRDFDHRRFATIADEIGAVSYYDASHPAGLIAAGLLRQPMEEGIDFVMSTMHKTMWGNKAAILVWANGTINEKVGGKGVNFSVFPGGKGGADFVAIAGVAAALKLAQTPEFVAHQTRVKVLASVMADELLARDWPLLTGGTDNHLILADVTGIPGLVNKTSKNGYRAANAFELGGIIANKNGFPHRGGKPKFPKGVRFGSHQLAMRGVTDGEAREVIGFIDEIVRSDADEGVVLRSRARVQEIAEARFIPMPVYI